MSLPPIPIVECRVRGILYIQLPPRPANNIIYTSEFPLKTANANRDYTRRHLFYLFSSKHYIIILYSIVCI